MLKTRDILLAGTILTSLAALPSPSAWAGAAGPVLLAQQEAPEGPDRARRQPPGPAAEPDRQKARPPAREPAQKPPTPAAQEHREPPQRPATQERREPPQRPAAQERREEQRPAAQERHEPPQRPTTQERREQPQRPTAQERREQPPQPAAQERREQPQRPAAQERREEQRPAAQEHRDQPQRPTAQERREERPAAQGHRPPQRPAQGQPTHPQPPAAQGQSIQPQPPAAQGQPARPQPSAAQERPGQPPAAQGQPAQPPTAQERPGQPQPPAAQQRPAQPQPPAAQNQPAQPQTPSAHGRPDQPPASTAQDRRPGAVEPPREQARDAREFLRQDAQQPGRQIQDVRQQRREFREGDRVFIREPDRTIIREHGRTIIRHSEVDRFTVGASDVRVERRGEETVSIVERQDGTRIVTVVDEDGRLIRRSRRDPGGREVVIIDNAFDGPRGGRRYSESYYVDLPPPVVRIPRERYIVEAERASPADIYAVLTAPPVDRIERRYTLDQVRYSPQLRDRMPRVDLDTITFDTGSWQLSPKQIDRLATIATALKQAMERNPREVFLIEGHTDAVGSDIDNLSLSDRRAESVAVALTERFQVPSENLTTQGYGEQYLKVQTQAAERQNRRVTVRRITPLIAGDTQDTSGAR